MTTAREAYDLAVRNGHVGTWAIAGTAVDRPYPCRCTLGRRCNPRFCTCSGRVDLDHVPAHCCSRYNTPEVAAKANRYGGRT